MEIAGKPYVTPNVGKAERALSVIAWYAAGRIRRQETKRRRRWIGAPRSRLAAARITGFCYTYQYLGVRTADVGQGANVSVPYELGMRVDRAITINKPTFGSVCFLARSGESPEIYEAPEIGESNW